MTNYKALLAALLAFTGLATAHMEMTYPPPLLFKSNPNTSPDKVDYSMTSPLRADGSDFPCKGYLSLLNTPEGKAVASWTAGGTYNFTISGGAAHGGGSCQAALSVDGGRTFRVMHSYEGGCPGQGQSFFAFAVPGDVPATEQGVFAWTWFNNLGNREMYMNCAVVVIEGSSGGGSDRVSFDDRPGLFTANIGNGCRTVDSADVKYPDPGPDVDSNGSSTPPTGSCGAESSSGRGSPGSGGNAGSCSGTGQSIELSTQPSQIPSPTRAPYTSSSIASSSLRGCHPQPTSTAVAITDDTGKTWTPGNDWPSWFQSGTPKMAGCVHWSALVWAILLIQYVF